MVKKHLGEIQAVDYGLGALIASCYQELAPNAGPEAFRRFQARPTKDKIFLVRNDDIQGALKKLAQHKDDKGQSAPDLPVVLYYRQTGIAADMMQHTQVWEVRRFISEKSVSGMDTAMEVTTVPITLTYSVLFLAWDRATIDHLTLAWWAHTSPLFRKNTRFTVTYLIDGEECPVNCFINSPREVLTSAEEISPEIRMWGARTMVEINTQAVYAGKLEIPDTSSVIGEWRI